MVAAARLLAETVPTFSGAEAWSGKRNGGKTEGEWLAFPRKMASILVIATRKFTCYPPPPILHRRDLTFREVHILTKATQPPVLRAGVHT